ncbi:hypothetical protein GGQ99_001351 [Aminobacter niigataensis]|uniref:DUF4326 domain-containing protein n=1 Tax=Aminobacter niigataensis TaxID=83265 RepID=A0ABR6KYM6_9HYPH|nr:DUF4326 domain-containing protein [Aminobacter niigataensis]MBB4649629.1 hypothetical protein [Aminobacter niigataensis]
MARRVQLSRKKGWKMPENTVKVDRSTRWGNPFKVTPEHAAAEAVSDFRDYVIGRLVNGVGYPLAELRGKNLACWCRLDQPCHADVLLDLANAPAPAHKEQAE